MIENKGGPQTDAQIEEFYAAHGTPEEDLAKFGLTKETNYSKGEEEAASYFDLVAQLLQLKELQTDSTKPFIVPLEILQWLCKQMVNVDFSLHQKIHEAWRKKNKILTDFRAESQVRGLVNAYIRQNLREGKDDTAIKYQQLETNSITISVLLEKLDMTKLSGISITRRIQDMSTLRNDVSSEVHIVDNFTVLPMFMQQLVDRGMRPAYLQQLMANIHSAKPTTDSMPSYSQTLNQEISAFITKLTEVILLEKNALESLSTQDTANDDLKLDLQTLIDLMELKAKLAIGDVSGYTNEQLISLYDELADVLAKIAQDIAAFGYEVRQQSKKRHQIINTKAVQLDLIQPYILDSVAPNPEQVSATTLPLPPQQRPYRHNPNL